MLKKIYYKFAMMAYRKDAQRNTANRSEVHKDPKESIYHLSFKDIAGKEVKMDAYRGKFILISNTASACGFTPQYKELQELQEKYKGSLEVIGFPADNFGAQEPLENEDIGAFCERNYGVKFSLAEKSDVIGENQNNIFNWLSKTEKNGWNNKEPKWNFSKYLISPEGKLLGFFPSAVAPLSKEITKFL